jgi:hypothetical protein
MYQTHVCLPVQCIDPVASCNTHFYCNLANDFHNGYQRRINTVGYGDEDIKHEYRSLWETVCNSIEKGLQIDLIPNDAGTRRHGSTWLQNVISSLVLTCLVEAGHLRRRRSLCCDRQFFEARLPLRQQFSRAARAACVHTCSRLGIFRFSWIRRWMCHAKRVCCRAKRVCNSNY